MPLPIPGFTPREATPAVSPVTMIVAEVVSANALIYKGERVEWFRTHETPATVAVGARVLAMYVPECGQCFVVEVIP